MQQSTCGQINLFLSQLPTPTSHLLKVVNSEPIKRSLVIGLKNTKRLETKLKPQRPRGRTGTRSERKP